MSQEHFEAFLADVRRANRTFKESKSSLKGLIQHLRSEIADPHPITYDQAKQKTENPYDRRLAKYESALRRLAKAWGTSNPYIDEAVWIHHNEGSTASDRLEIIDNSANSLRFARAFKLARFFHGTRRGNTDELMEQGLKIDESCSPIGATDPGMRTLDGGGPVFLGMTYEIGYDYAKKEEYVLRVFLDSSRATRPFPDRGNRAKFVRGDSSLYIDHDNPNARYTMADIPGTALFAGSVRDVILSNPDSARTAEVLRAIGTHDPTLPRDTAALLNLLQAALDKNEVRNCASKDVD